MSEDSQSSSLLMFLLSGFYSACSPLSSCVVHAWDFCFAKTLHKTSTFFCTEDCVAQ